jgi:prophage maintenance system killer protein
MYVFLRLNRHVIEGDEPEVVRMVLALAAGDLDEVGVIEWLRQHTVSAQAAEQLGTSAPSC